MSKKIFNVVLLILLIILEFTTIFFITAKLTLKKDNINKIITNTTNELLVDEVVLDKATTKISEYTNINKDIIENAIKSETAKNIISNITSNVIDYNLGKKDKLSSDEIYNIVEENIDTISKETGYKLTDKDKENILKEVKNNKNKIIESLYNGDLNE